MLPDPDVFADALAVAIRSTLAPLQATLAGVREVLTGLEQKVDALTALRERVAVLETRPIVPGPPGDPGPAGRDGKDGSPGLAYRGVWEAGQAYEAGQLVTWAGSAWHCNTATLSKPGDGVTDWTLMVKRGRDGRDGGPK